MISSEDFAQARQAFTQWAQGALGTKELKILPDRVEGISNRPSIGQAIAFEAFPTQGDTRRGWATPVGDIALSPNTLLALTQASGLWTEDPKVKRTDLAKALIWPMGQGYRIWKDPTRKAHPPRMIKTPAGDSELVFFIAHRRPGPGGAGGGPETTSRCVLSVNPQQATLAVTSYP